MLKSVLQREMASLLFPGSPVQRMKNTRLLPVLSVALMIVSVVAVQAGPSVALSPERAAHGATLLNSGKVLITGGVNESTNLGDALLYDEATDTYRCPAGQMLHYYRTTDKSDGRRIRIYRTEACIACHFRSACTTSPRGRYINRWEHEAVLDRLKQRLVSQPEMIKHRKAIIEHIFGTIKKIWGYSALLLRGLANIAGEVALMNLSYNIRRVLSIVGTRKLILALQHS